ncbi:MAG: M48 family metalloprotease [Candidatus Thermoplasmatota archaeon]|nr:M48 family metalloprotease [Candidatus Thermoplasmatota archaeon]
MRSDRNKREGFKLFFKPYFIVSLFTLFMLLIFQNFIFEHPSKVETVVLSAIPIFIFPAELGILYYRYLKKWGYLSEPRNADMDYELSEIYTEKYGKLTYKNDEIKKIDIYIYSSFNFFNKSPVGLHDSKTPKILIKDDFLRCLNNDEMDAVILHELYHFIENDNLKRKILAIAMLLSVGAIIFALLTIFLYGTRISLLLKIIIGSLVFVAIIYLLLVIIVPREETKCDIFSIQVLKKDFVSSGLVKTLNYQGQYVRGFRFNSMLRQINKRLTKIREYNETP